MIKLQKSLTSNRNWRLNPIITLALDDLIQLTLLTYEFSSGFSERSASYDCINAPNGFNKSKVNNKVIIWMESVQESISFPKGTRLYFIICPKHRKYVKQRWLTKVLEEKTYLLKIGECFIIEIEDSAQALKILNWKGKHTNKVRFYIFNALAIELQYLSTVEYPTISNT
jgi:hypothetical protein